MKKGVKTVIIAVAVLVCVCAAVLAVKYCVKSEPSETSVAEGSQLTEKPVIPSKSSYRHNNSGFRFSELFSYSGKYVEDGTDDIESNIAAVRIENNTGKTCRYAEVSVLTDDGVFEFEFTTLKDGECVTVLEKNRKHYTRSIKINSISVENKVWFEDEPGLYEDIFELTVYDKVINIKNISKKDIDGTIYVYYKNAEENGLLGGITYRIPFDSLKAGELKQASSIHLSKENSVMEFITYEH